jgi:hypothetical protein
MEYENFDTNSVNLLDFPDVQAGFALYWWKSLITSGSDRNTNYVVLSLFSCVHAKIKLSHSS